MARLEPLLVLIVENDSIRVIEQPDPREQFCTTYRELNPAAVCLPVEARDLKGQRDLPGRVELGRV